MDKQILHITNGDSLTSCLRDLDFPGEILTWEEMLCEGPTLEYIYTNKFLDLRKSFFSSYYDIELDVTKIKQEIDKLNHPEHYSEIVLWFEYDLFCHINMVAVITLIHQKKIKLPISLVCSGRTVGSKNLKGLSDLSQDQLENHYNSKVRLTEDDISLAKNVWRIYCGIDHNLFKPLIMQSSSFKYLSNCLKAHLERFPDSKTGLNILETNILKIVKDSAITSRHHLLGYALNYQGYYGYGDLQLSRMIDNLSVFFTETEQSLTLNRKGHEALLGLHNVSAEFHNDMIFGGVKKVGFQFSKEKNKLIKSILNAY
ncbi:DUF1835 domain-containing protein [Changchengzhania lutea]|uniref:DUF1835 domain-containing protein n=1 Tax=Changchengzhania lutea TaxID=2049305 RepID=UPI00115DEFA2|nr:DUF1835 domain-containing protein [Changchengzhania lutea]